MNTHIRVRRFAPSLDKAAVYGQVDFPDGSVALVDGSNKTTFWRRESRIAIGQDEEEVLIDAELPSRGLSPSLDPIAPGEWGPGAEPVNTGAGKEFNPFDFRVVATDGDNQYAPGFFALLKRPAMIAWGATEHAALRSLFQLCIRSAAAGDLDPEGQPILAINHRRYHAVWEAAVASSRGTQANGETPQSATDRRDLNEHVRALIGRYLDESGADPREIAEEADAMLAGGFGVVPQERACVLLRAIAGPGETDGSVRSAAPGVLAL